MHYTEEDVRKVWDSDMSEAEKRLATAGMVLSTTEANNLHCVLVGGLAVELYAAGNYATSDRWHPVAVSLLLSKVEDAIS